MDRDGLVQAILDLEKDRAPRVVDPMLAHQLAHHVKPHIDRLAALTQGLPIDEDELAIDSLAAEDEAAAPATEAEDKKPRRKRAIKKKPSLEGPIPELSTLPSQDRARWIFMERFIPLEQHETILGYNFDTDDFDRYQQDLNNLLDNLLALPNITSAVQSNDIPALQKIFASSLLIFRNPFIGDEDGNPIPCSVENLRKHYPSYFYKRRKTPNWYEKQTFYTEPLGQTRWALCEIDYLNCTLRSPENKLAGYAKHWHIPTENVPQKTVLEDIYDRIICGEALEENLFEQNCNCCTATTYRHKEKSPLRMAFIVQKNQKIALHGKRGIPHWRATRRLWPGVFPTIVFS